MLGNLLSETGTTHSTFIILKYIYAEQKRKKQVPSILGKVGYKSI
jgi:hypothetical protein